MVQGKFIVLEGICGAGKTTLANRLVEMLLEKGIKAIYNHGSCTYTSFGRSCKEIVKKYPVPFSTSYYLADIIQDTVHTITPMLNQGYWVVQDRYIDSITSYSYAYYQKEGLEVDLTPVIETYQSLHLLRKPDITIWCKAPRDVILHRLRDSDESERQHHQYNEQPILIDLVQQQYEKMMIQRRIGTDTFIVTTDNPFTLSSIWEVLAYEKSMNGKM